MNSKYLLILLLSLGLNHSLSGQCIPGNSCFDAPLICGSVLDGFNSTTGPPNDITDPGIFCGEVENNQWIRFVACEPQVIIDLIVNSCDGTLQGSGLQAQIFSTDDCFNFTSVSNCFSADTPINGTLTANGLTPGNIYYLMIDGWSSDICNFNIDIISGIDTDPPNPILIADGMINGPLSVCPGETVSYTVTPPQCSNASTSGCPLPVLPPADFTYQWILPPGATINGNPNSGTVDITWGSTGGTLDVILQNNNTASCNSCDWNCSTEVIEINVDVNAIPPNATVLPTVYICDGESYEFCGTFYTTTIDAVCSSNCIDGTIQPIVVLPTVYNDLDTITLCNNECFSINGEDFCDAGFFTSTVQTNTECTVNGFYLSEVSVNGFFTPDGILTPTITSVEIIGGGMSTSGNLEYLWTGPGIDPTNNTQQNPVVSAPGIYMVTITDPDTGCSITIDVFVPYQDNDCNLPVPPMDSCMGAPLFCGPILDGYCSFTDPFTPIIEGNLASEFCFDIDNNSWIRFLPCDSIVELEINVGDCTLGQGVEAAIFSIEDCQIFSRLSNCIATNTLNADTLTATNLIPGEIYYLMVDGINTSECNWEVNVVSGISVEDVTLTQTAEPSLSGVDVVCLGETHTYTAIPPVCELTGGDNCPYTFQLDSVEIEWIIPTGGEIVSQSGLEIEIHWAAGQGGDLSVLITTALTDDAAFCASSSTCGSFASIPITVNYYVDYLPAVNLCRGESYTFCGVVYTETIDATCLDSCGQTVQPIIVSDPMVTDFGVISLCPGDCYTYAGINYCQEESVELIEAGPVCIDTVRFEVDFLEEEILTVSPVIEDCDVGGTFYRVIFDVTGGIPPYFVNSLPLTGTTFTSPPILSGNDYYYEISHSDVCSDSLIVYAGQVNCSCTTDAGTMDQELLINCDSEPITATHNANEFLDNDDTFEYVLHSGDTTALVDPIAINFDGTFNFIPGVMQYGQIYYISYVAGNAIDGGFVGLNDLCLSVSIGQPIVFYPQPIADAGMDITLSCLNPTESLQGVNNNAPSIGFHWTGPNNFSDSTLSPMVTDPGTYVFVAGDSITGCISNDTVIVFPDFDPPTVTAAGGTLNCNFPELTLNASSPNDPQVDYEWTTPLGINTSEDSILANEIGDYQLIASGQNGCKDTLLIPIIDGYIIPEITAAGGILTCNFQNIPLSVNSSVNNVAYLWTGPGTFSSTNPAPMVGEGGSYTLEVKEMSSGCAVDTVVEVIDNILYPFADAGNPITIDCHNPALPLIPGNNSSGPAIIYSWTGPGGFSSSDYDPVVDMDGNYEMTVTDTINGCANSSSVMVIGDFTEPNLMPLAEDTINCYTPSINLSGQSTSPSVNYQWILPSGDTLDQQNLSVATDGNYELLLTTPNGCQSNDFVTITDGYNYPEIGTTGGILNCYFPNLQLASSSNLSSVTYQWTGPLGYSSNDPQPTIDLGGNFQLIVTDTISGCSSDSLIEVIDQIIFPLADAGNELTLDCNDPSLNLMPGNNSVGPNILYSWTGPGGFSSTNYDPLVSEEGNYLMTVLDTLNGCSTSSEVMVIGDFTEPDLHPLSADTVNCYTPSISLNGQSSTPGILYQWILPTGDTLDQQNLIVTEEGDYQLLLTAPNGCQSNDIASIADTYNYPVIGATGGILNCYMPSFNLGSSSNLSTVDYLWSGPAGFSSTEAQPEVDLGGSYLLVVTDVLSGCSSDSLVEVLDEIYYPMAEAGNAEELTCDITSISLNGTGSTEGDDYKYQWLAAPGLTIENDNSLRPRIFASGWYTLEVLNTYNGCISRDSVFAPENDNRPYLLETVADPLRCYGDSNAILFVEEVQGGVPPFTYALDDQFFSTADQFSNLKAGDYALWVEDANGCLFEQTVTITEPPLVEVSLGPDRYIELGESVLLNADVSLPDPLIESLEWQSNTNESLADAVTWEVRPFYNTTYNVTLSDFNNCTDTAQVRVWVDRTIPVYIPSGFSPNGDLNNDRFTLFASSQVTKIKVMRVYSRWGELVFERQNFLPNEPDLGWDGTFIHQEMNDAVFVYYFEVESIEGLIYTFKGDVTLIR